MSKDKSKETCNIPPIEKHDTAAWANITQQKPVSKVPVPSDFEVSNSKNWVDQNEK